MNSVFSNAEGQESLLVIINVYCPRAELGNRDRLEYKLRFYRLLQLRAEALVAAGRYSGYCFAFHFLSFIPVLFHSRDMDIYYATPKVQTHPLYMDHL